MVPSTPSISKGIAATLAADTLLGLASATVSAMLDAGIHVNAYGFP